MLNNRPILKSWEGDLQIKDMFKIEESMYRDEKAPEI